MRNGPPANGARSFTNFFGGGFRTLLKEAAEERVPLFYPVYWRTLRNALACESNALVSPLGPPHLGEDPQVTGPANWGAMGGPVELAAEKLGPAGLIFGVRRRANDPNAEGRAEDSCGPL